MKMIPLEYSSAKRLEAAMINRTYELGLEHGRGRLDPAAQGGRHRPRARMLYAPLDVGDGLSGVCLIPAPINPAFA